MQKDQIRFILKVVFNHCNLIVIKKNGYKIINVIAKFIKNHAFHIGANMRFKIFKTVKIQMIFYFSISTITPKTLHLMTKITAIE